MTIQVITISINQAVHLKLNTIKGTKSILSKIIIQPQKQTMPVITKAHQFPMIQLQYCTRNWANLTF